MSSVKNLAQLFESIQSSSHSSLPTPPHSPYPYRQKKNSVTEVKSQEKEEKAKALDLVGVNKKKLIEGLKLQLSSSKKPSEVKASKKEHINSTRNDYVGKIHSTLEPEERNKKDKLEPELSSPPKTHGTDDKEDSVPKPLSMAQNLENQTPIIKELQKKNQTPIIEELPKENQTPTTGEELPKETQISPESQKKKEPLRTAIQQLSVLVSKVRQSFLSCEKKGAEKLQVIKENGIKCCGSIKQTVAEAYSTSLQFLQKLPKVYGRSFQIYCSSTPSTAKVALAVLLISFICSLHPTVPRGSTPLLSFTYVQASTTEYKSHISVTKCIVLLFTFSVLIDLVWLLGKYHPIPLSSSEADFWYDNDNKTKELVTHIFVGIHSLCKMCLCWSYCKNTEVGVSFILCLKKLLPTSLEEANSKRQLISRIMIIAWLEVFSVVIFLSCAIYIMLRLSWAYNASSFLFDLPSILLLKAGTGVLFTLGVIKNIGTSFLFQELGCIPLDEDISRVKIDGEFLKFNSLLKVMDFFFGLGTTFSLASSFVLGEEGIEEVRFVTFFVSLALFVNSVMSVALWLSVCWYSSIISHSEENEERVEENHTFGSPPESQVAHSLENVIENASNIITNPLEFAMEWKQLAPGFRRRFQASYIPSNETCTHALEASGFHVVASGSVQKETKIYCFTFIAGEQFLLEVTSNPLLGHVEVQIKAKLSSKRLVDSNILSKLPLKELFGISLQYR